MASKKNSKKTPSKTNGTSGKAEGAVPYSVLATKIHDVHWNYVNDAAEELGWTLSKFIREGVLSLAERTHKAAGKEPKRPDAPEPRMGKRSALGELAAAVGLTADEYRKFLVAKAVAEGSGKAAPKPEAFKTAKPAKAAE